MAASSFPPSRQRAQVIELRRYSKRLVAVFQGSSGFVAYVRRHRLFPWCNTKKLGAFFFAISPSPNRSRQPRNCSMKMAHHHHHQQQQQQQHPTSFFSTSSWPSPSTTNNPSSFSSSSPSNNTTTSTHHPIASRGDWTTEQDEALRFAVRAQGGKNWKKIAQEIPGEKTHVQCLQRWNKVIKPGLIKGPWKQSEDDLLRLTVDEIAKNNWVAVSERVPGRTPKQCRERWLLCLDPKIRKEKWTPDEDQHLLQLHKEHGNSWAFLAKQLDGRTENAIKSRMKSLQKKLERQGCKLSATSSTQSSPPPPMLPMPTTTTTTSQQQQSQPSMFPPVTSTSRVNYMPQQQQPQQFVPWTSTWQEKYPGWSDSVDTTPTFSSVLHQRVVSMPQTSSAAGAAAASFASAAGAEIISVAPSDPPSQSNSVPIWGEEDEVAAAATAVKQTLSSPAAVMNPEDFANLF